MQAENLALASANAEQGKQLSEADRKVRIQAVLEKARAEFSNDEAEAYQQGENLVIRLKKMNFTNGSSDLPADSLALLAKVLECAKSLNPSQILVEGHTDSTGTAASNKALSESRANADIKIESEGFGFSKPIASNKSKQGRAQNRRVDVIITPEVLQ
jgi:outer membrane protein OmpA-like peptidoglycan-associated protein